MIYMLNKIVKFVINIYNYIGYNDGVIIISSFKTLSVKHIMYNSAKIVLFNMLKFNLMATIETIIITSLISFFTNKKFYKQKMISNNGNNQNNNFITIATLLLKFVMCFCKKIILWRFYIYRS